MKLWQRLVLNIMDLGCYRAMNRQILQIDISFERTMLIVAERFIISLINKYGKHYISTDGIT